MHFTLTSYIQGLIHMIYFSGQAGSSNNTLLVYTVVLNKAGWISIENIRVIFEATTYQASMTLSQEEIVMALMLAQE